MDIEGFDASFSNKEYAQQFVARMNDRINFVKSRETEKAGIDKLPADALEALESVVSQATAFASGILEHNNAGTFLVCGQFPERLAASVISLYIMNKSPSFYCIDYRFCMYVSTFLRFKHFSVTFRVISVTVKYVSINKVCEKIISYHCKIFLFRRRFLQLEPILTAFNVSQDLSLFEPVNICVMPEEKIILRFSRYHKFTIIFDFI